MSEDQRVSRNPGEPPKDGPAGMVRWADYLTWCREEAIEAVLRLPESERRTARVPSGWTPIELLSHLLHMEQRWFVWGFLGEAVTQPWGDWDVPDPGAVPEGAPSPRWQVPATHPAEAIADALRAIGERTTRLLLTHEGTDPARLGGRFEQDPPTLEWICFHVLAEYARHLGHLDIVVELSRPEGSHPS